MNDDKTSAGDQSKDTRQTKKDETSKSRIRIISSITTYLRFFALAILVTEALLTYLTTLVTDQSTIKYISFVIVGTLPLLVIVVAVLAALEYTKRAQNKTGQGNVLQSAERIGKVMVFILTFGALAIAILAIAASFLAYEYIDLNSECRITSSTNALLVVKLQVADERNQSLIKENEGLKVQLEPIGTLTLSNALLVEKLTTVRATLDKKEVEITSLGERLGKAEQEAQGDAQIISDMKWETNRQAEVAAANTELERELQKGVLHYEDLNQMLQLLRTNQQLLESRYDEVRRERDQLAAVYNPIQKAGLERFFERANDFHSEFLSLLHQSQQELFFFGFNFYITAGEKRADILEILQKGVSVQFLVYDPYSPEMERAAHDFGQPVENLRQECELGVAAFQNLLEDWKAAKAANPQMGVLEIRFTKSIPRARIQFIDPRLQTGHTFIVPYVNRQNSSNLPGFLFSNSGAAAPQYFLGIRQLWNEAQDISKLPTTVALAANSIAQNVPAVAPSILTGSQSFTNNTASATNSP